MNNERRKETIETIGKMFNHNTMRADASSQEERNKAEVDAFIINEAFAAKLKKYGPPIVDLILEELKRRETKGILFNSDDYGQPVSHLMEVVYKLAKPKHAETIVKMLLWKTILSEEHRSTRGTILETLRRIGDLSILVHLEKYTGKVPQIKYKDNAVISAALFQKWDITDVNEVMKSIRGS